MSDLRPDAAAGPLSDLHAGCLTALRGRTRPDGEMCVAFVVLEGETGLARADVRRSLRALARKGWAEFHNGLTDEDGDLAGAGYCISRQGIRRAEAIDG